ncbi:MAG: hypothetical protein ACUVXI_17185 [bacterium]
MKPIDFILSALIVAIIALLTVSCPSTGVDEETGVEGRVILIGIADSPAYLRIYRAADVEDEGGRFDATKFQTALDEATGRPTLPDGAPAPETAIAPIWCDERYDYKILLDKGRYYAFAFMDTLYKNGEYDPQEPMDFSERVSLKKGEVKPVEDLFINLNVQYEGGSEALLTQDSAPNGISNDPQGRTPIPLDEGKIFMGHLDGYWSDSSTPQGDWADVFRVPVGALPDGASITVELGGLAPEESGVSADADLDILEDDSTRYGGANAKGNFSGNYGTATERVTFKVDGSKDAFIKVFNGHSDPANYVVKTYYFLRWTRGVP